jgi:hypothetical protein
MGNHNFKLPKQQPDGAPLFAPTPRQGSEVVLGSHNFCDQTTWFGDSVRVVGRQLAEKVGSSGLIWKSPVAEHVNWIDMVTGRVHNQEHWAAEVGRHYAVTVTVDSVEQTVCPPFKFESSDGDYWIDYDNGEVNFFSDQTGKTVVASFSYATESAFYITPYEGTILRIEDAEADFSADMVLETSFGYIVEGYVDVFAPEMTPVPFPSGTRISLQTDYYHRVTQIITEARGALPQVEAIGAKPEHKAITDIKEFRRKSRGMKAAVQAVPFNYSTARDLTAAYGMRLKIVTQDHIPVGGEMLTMTFYCTSMEE